MMFLPYIQKNVFFKQIIFIYSPDHDIHFAPFRGSLRAKNSVFSSAENTLTIQVKLSFVAKTAADVANLMGCVEGEKN